jgi:hypothetical protein
MIHLTGGTLSLGGTWLSLRSGLGQSR